MARITELLEGEMSLDDFYRWYSPYALQVTEQDETPAEQALLDLELHFAEYTSGHRTEAELRDAIAEVGQELRQNAAA